MIFTLAVHVFHKHPAVECQRAQDAQLVGRVKAFHVRRGVGLRKTQALGVLQYRFIFGAFRRHPGEDVVGRAVDNTHDLLNMIGDQRGLDRVDDRDRAADAGFVVQARAGLLCHLPQFVKMKGKRHLVRGDNGLAVLQRAQHHGRGRLFAAQEFADDIDLRILQDIVLISGQHLIRHFLAAMDLLVQHESLLHTELHARALSDFTAEFPDQIPDASADVSQSQQSQHASI